jgi:hypothetical protein
MVSMPARGVTGMVRRAGVPSPTPARAHGRETRCVVPRRISRRSGARADPPNPSTRAPGSPGCSAPGSIQAGPADRSRGKRRRGSP